MFRKFYEILKKWETDRVKEPLLVVGARQVGKTWIVRKFCEEQYPRYRYFNFETTPGLESVFAGELNPERIIENLEILSGESISEDTALFFDEIQKSEKAITALKYFCESEKNYRIIGAGSLLGVKLSRFESAFPVGKVRLATLFPMDFEEFLLALGEDRLATAIRQHLGDDQPMPDVLHEKALGLYQAYLYVGGMPQCVADYSKKRNIPTFDRQLQENILLSYVADMNKYTLSAAEGVKIEEVFRSIPRQLARENPKFKYKEVRANANKRDFWLPLDWLVSSRLVNRVSRISWPQSPLKVYAEENSFKVYLADTGLLSCEARIAYRDLQPESENIFKGVLTENYVVQQLISSGREAFYFKPDAGMEIDLLLEREGEVIPLEIKSGRHVRSTSLKNYCEKYKPPEALRVSYRNFGASDSLRSVPVYAVCALFSE